MMSKMLTCDECGAEWKANYGNTWFFMGGVYDSAQCRDDAKARWQAAQAPAEDADAPDAAAVAHLEEWYAQSGGPKD